MEGTFSVFIFDNFLKVFIFACEEHSQKIAKMSAKKSKVYKKSTLFQLSILGHKLFPRRFC